MDTDSSKLHCTREVINVITSVKEEENPDDMDASLPSHHPNSKAAIKQENDENSLASEVHASITIFPHTLHSPSHLLIKKENSTVMLNYDMCQVKTEPESEDEKSLEDETSVNDSLETAMKREIPNGERIDHYLREDGEKNVMLNYTYQVKTEPESENEQSLEEEISVDQPLGTTIKQEITDGNTMDNCLKDEDEINKVPDTVTDENEGMSYSSIIEVDQQQHSSDDECHTCRFCGKNFKSVDLLNKHMMTHPSDYARTYACDYCKKAFRSKYSLTTHKAKQQSKENLYSCDICGNTFDWNCQLKSHKEICRHSKERPYSCDMCGKDFKLKAHLKDHKAIFHSNETPYTCDICNKTFKLKSSLQRHIATCHSTEKPYPCDVCGKAFKWSGALNIHKISRHSNERPYTCDVCGKAFKQQAYLFIHLRIHSDERPYSCDVCGKGFKVQSYLVKHKWVHIDLESM